MTTQSEVELLAADLARLLNKNIKEIIATITVNIDVEKQHTVLAAFAALYSVQSYFEYKLHKMQITQEAIDKAKEGADRYVADVISADVGGFPVNRGDA